MWTTRFAPSPTGYLHLGHAYSALLGYRAAQAASGRFLLRLEDIDASRCRAEYAEAIFEDLAWLGIQWSQPVWQQSGRMAVYAAALAQLEAQGLIYRCFCTRAEIAAEIGASPSAPLADGPPAYPGTCRHRTAQDVADRAARGDAFAWRLDSAAALARHPLLSWHEGDAPPQRVEPGFGDVVLARKDTPASYHLCVVLDDAAQGITHIYRGQDLQASTPIHRLLQALMRLPVPHYVHHRLLTGPDGRKFAKRDASLTLRALRQAGTTPADIMAMVGLSDDPGDPER